MNYWVRRVTPRLRSTRAPSRHLLPALKVIPFEGESMVGV